MNTAVEMFSSVSYSESLLMSMVARNTICQLMSVTPFDIDNIFTEIDKNNKTIAALLRLKNLVYGRIQSTMELFAHSQRSLSSTEINSYCIFLKDYENLSNELMKTLELTEDSRALHKAQKAILHDTPNLKLAYNELRRMGNAQQTAIAQLQYLLEISKRQLQVLVEI